MIKIFYLIGTGYVIAGISETEHKGDHTIMTYPSKINMIQDEADHIGVKFGTIIAPFLKHYREMMEKFIIKNASILFSDDPGDDIVASYEQWVANMKTQLSGIIQPVGSGGIIDINKGRGGRPL